MSRIVIFEGIASSGKSTLERILAEEFRTRGSVEVVDEVETLIPLLENRDPETARRHLLTFIERFRSSTADWLIVDRFLFTHVFRTASSLSDFADIEHALHDLEAHIILLTMDEAVVSSRIEETSRIRGSDWAPGRKGTVEERERYYIGQQRRLRELAKETFSYTFQSRETFESGTRQSGTQHIRDSAYRLAKLSCSGYSHFRRQ